MKLKPSGRFTTLWIYTILKLEKLQKLFDDSFTTLWIYTILKRIAIAIDISIVSLPYGFTLFSNPLKKAISFC